MKKIIIFILFLFSISYVAIVAQSKSDQLKKNKQKIEKEINNTQQLLNQTRKNKKASLEQISVLRNQISKREELILALNNEIFALEEEAELNNKLSKNLERKLDYMKSDYSRVIYVAYKNRKLTNQLMFVLSSEDFGQMYRRMKYYRAFSQNVKNQVVQIEKTRADIEAKEIELQLIKDEKLALLSGKEQQLTELENEERQKKKLANQLKSKEKKLAEEIRKRQQKQRELDKAIQKAIQQEIAAANAKKKQKTNSKSTTKTNTGKTSNPSMELTAEESQLNTSFSGNKGKLPWPVTKCSKIRDFGTYPHPDAPSVQLQNNGIDLLTEAGANVRSVFQGVVLRILDYAGTKVIIIRHGSYMTVYQNVTGICVKQGDKVSTKQTIGKVALNSSSSTYILHFEICTSDNHLNPSSWLAR